MRVMLRQAGITKLFAPLIKRVRTVQADNQRRSQLEADPEMRLSRQRLQQFRNQYQGKRCFIMGNGPSLNKTDLTQLTREYTFVLNRGYLLLPKIGEQHKFLVSVNGHVIEQFANEMRGLAMPKFISWQWRQHIPLSDQMAYLPTQRGVGFSLDPTLRLYEGSTVTFVAMELAYWMGFNEVVLIGVDHNFTTQGQAHKLVQSEGDDPNHFDPNYFGKGVNWQLPSLDESEQAYHRAKGAFEASGRRIVDATVGGKLQVFPKVPYESLFV